MLHTLFFALTITTSLFFIANSLYNYFKIENGSKEFYIIQVIGLLGNIGMILPAIHAIAYPSQTYLIKSNYEFLSALVMLITGSIINASFINVHKTLNSSN